MSSQTTLVEIAGRFDPVAPVRSWRQALRRSPWALRIGSVVVAAYIVVAVFAPLVATADPVAQDLGSALQNPSRAHLLGTDNLGRDVFSRMVYAARYDLLVAFGATLLALALGTALGVLAGYFRWLVDGILSRVNDLLMTIPPYALLVLTLFALGSGGPSVVLALGLTGWVGYARVARAQVLVVRELDYIAAARLGGLSSWRIMRRHLVPNILGQLLVLWSSDVVIAIGGIAALGFLGIGIQPPTAEWGVMVQEGQDYLLTNWWLSVAPGLVIAVLGIGLALISDAVSGSGRSA